VLAVETQERSERDLGAGTTLDLAAGMAASLAAAILADGDSLRVLAPGYSDWRDSGSRGMDVMPGILEVLARMEATAGTSVADELREMSGRLAAGTLVCWLTPSPGPQLMGTARLLRAAGLRPVVYALDDATSERAGAWDSAVAELRAALVPTVRLRRGDELVERLLS
jgi:hypothetical protein